MMQPIEFRAPWSATLRVTTTIATLVLLATTAFGLLAYTRMAVPVPMLLIVMPLLLLALALPFTVRGYVLTQKAIVVKRLGWSTSLPLNTLQSVSGDTEAMRGSLRLFGTGGLYSFTGEFWNRRLGRFRALATDPERAIVLRYPQRVIVITPHDPQQFIMRTRTLLKTAEFPG